MAEPEHPNPRIESALRAAEEWADAHSDADGVSVPVGGQLRQLVGIIVDERAEVTRLQGVLQTVINELDAIEDLQYHDIDGDISTKPWANSIVSGSKRIRRIAEEALK